MLLLGQEDGQLLLQGGQLQVEVVAEVLVLLLQGCVLGLDVGAHLGHNVCVVCDQAGLGKQSAITL